MDRVIAKKKWTSKKLLTIGGIIALAGLIAASIYFTSGKKRLNVDTERITITEVKRRPSRKPFPLMVWYYPSPPFTWMPQKVAG
ncbi:hypothetical protein [Paraflavitalea speifideaquila]|uniref:hypothetical protein n=1 Tax=Paraflavitalea speifideaquila TaxID=3076558 RepID=UPI0028ED92FD|nr:hypothetical protein [Paraflavitalea speifideiaquila]